MSEENPLAAVAAHIPFAQHLGVEVTELLEQRVVARMLVRPEFCNPMGGLHGGAMMSLADTLGAILAFRNLPEGAGGTTTLESKTNFIGPARVGEVVIGVCTPVHVGRRTSVWQTVIETEAGKKVGVVTQTQMTL